MLHLCARPDHPFRPGAALGWPSLVRRPIPQAIPRRLSGGVRHVAPGPMRSRCAGGRRPSVLRVRRNPRRLRRTGPSGWPPTTSRRTRSWSRSTRRASGAQGCPSPFSTASAPREVVAPALEQGVVDVVVEYLGTALVFASPPGSELPESPEEMHGPARGHDGGSRRRGTGGRPRGGPERLRRHDGVRGRAGCGVVVGAGPAGAGAGVRRAARVPRPAVVPARASRRSTGWSSASS